jgi:hypothetical protein
LVLQDLISHFNLNSLILNQWYLDDGHLAGKTADILEALKLIDTLGQVALLVGWFENSRC